MALDRMEKVGAALAFIPVVSTVVGIIKAYVYFKRSGKHTSELDQLKLQALAGGINSLAHKTLQQQESTLQKRIDLEGELGALSITEAIPLLNIFMATFELANLRRLSKNQLRLDGMIKTLPCPKQP